MSTGAIISPEVNTQHYETLVRISGVLSACRQPQEFTKILAEQLAQVLFFEYLDIVVFKEDSEQIDWLA
jgi:hypothetical protein